MWGLDHKEGWMLKNWSFWTLVLEKTLENSLDSKETKPVNPKGNQPWIFIGRTDVKLKLQYFGYLMWGANSLEKTLILGKIEGRRRRGQQRMKWLDSITDSMNMVWVNSRRQWSTGKPGICSPWGSKELDITEWLKNSNNDIYPLLLYHADYFHCPNILCALPICLSHLITTLVTTEFFF